MNHMSDFNTHEKVVELRTRFNDIKGILDEARSAIHWADHITEEVHHMANIAEKIEMEGLDPNAFVRNIELYIEDYLRKLETFVEKRREKGAL